MTVGQSAALGFLAGCAWASLCWWWVMRQLVRQMRQTLRGQR